MGDDGPCCNDGPGTDHRPVHHDGAHADQNVIFDGAAVNDGVVRNRNVAADGGRETLVSTVNHGPILYVGIIADADAVHITPYHGVEPDGAILPHRHVTYYGGVVGEPAMITKLGSHIPEGFDEGHGNLSDCD